MTSVNRFWIFLDDNSKVSNKNNPYTFAHILAAGGSMHGALATPLKVIASQSGKLALI